MPLYEYKCHSCGKTFEVIQKFSDQPLTNHAECGGSVERLISAAAFHLKGSGWYATDYAKKNGSEGKKDDATSPVFGRVRRVWAAGRAKSRPRHQRQRRVQDRRLTCSGLPP